MITARVCPSSLCISPFHSRLNGTTGLSDTNRVDLEIWWHGCVVLQWWLVHWVDYLVFLLVFINRIISIIHTQRNMFPIMRSFVIPIIHMMACFRISIMVIRRVNLDFYWVDSWFLYGFLLMNLLYQYINMFILKYPFNLLQRWQWISCILHSCVVNVYIVFKDVLWRWILHMDLLQLHLISLSR